MYMDAMICCLTTVSLRQQPPRGRLHTNSGAVLYIDYGLLGLRHVCDDSVRDDEQYEVLRAVRHR